MNDQHPTQLYITADLIAISTQAERTITHNISADLFLALVASAPHDAWADIVAAGIRGLLSEHPHPRSLLVALIYHLADVAIPASPLH